MNKKFLLGLMLTMLVFVLAACGGSGEESTTEEEASGDEAAAENSENSEEEASGEKTTVTFWHAMNGPHQEAITELTNKFNESQEAYEVVEQNQGDYSTLNQSIMASGVSDDLPTISQATASNIPDWASNDLIIPLDDVLAGENFDQETVDSIIPGFLDGSTYEEQTMAVPFSKSVRIMYVNEDILEEYDTEVPTSFEEVQALGEAMQEAGDERFALGLESGIEMELETMARQNGAEWISDDLSTVDIGEENATEPMQYIVDAIDAGWARTAGEDGFMSGPFGRGDVALYLGSSAGLSHVEPGAEESGMTWSTAELPVYNEGEPLTLLAGNDLTVFASATDEEQQGAAAFMNFLLQPENTAEWAIATGYVPVTTAGLEDESYQTYLEENPNAAAAATETEYAIASPMFAGSGEYRDSMLEAQDAILIDDADVTETMQNLQEEVTTIIEENN